MSDAEVHDIGIQVLRSIRDEIAAFRSETRDAFVHVNRRLERLEANGDDTNRRLDLLVGRFDSLLEFAGERYRDHEVRLQCIERQIQKLTTAS